MLLADGTVIWTSPTDQTYVTVPGSALPFPQLCAPTGPPPQATYRSGGRCGEKAVMMPTRRRTRAQNLARYVTAERRLNRQVRDSAAAVRQARRARIAAWTTPAGSSGPGEDPPPF